MMDNVVSLRPPSRKRPDLPEFCYAVDPTSDVVTLIVNGEEGYRPMPSLSRGQADGLNHLARVTPAQREAMLFGSMFGWSLEGANPENHKDARKYEP